MSGQREWQPGDVALVTTRYGWTGVAIRTDGPAPWHNYNGLWSTHEIVEARPLVVISPEDREQVERLLNRQQDIEAETHPNLRPIDCRSGSCWIDTMQAALREFANPTPPRTDEPGTWGVVEASCVHSDERRKWARHDDGNWYPIGSVGREAGLPDDWDSLKGPALIREGVN